MTNLIDLSKKFNHRWKTDRLFIEGFDYDHPKYANIPDDMKWMLPMREAQKSPDVRFAHAKSSAESKARVEDEFCAKRLANLKVFQNDKGER